MDTIQFFDQSKAGTSAGLKLVRHKSLSTNKIIIFALLICSLSAISCSSTDQSQNSQQANKQDTTKTKKLDEIRAKLTLVQYVWDEIKKAHEYLKIGEGDQDFFASTVKISNVQQKGNVAEVTVFWNQMFMILKGKTAETYQGEGKATFELKDEKWFLTRVSGPRDFMRDNLTIEVK